MSTSDAIPGSDETAHYYDIVNEVFVELWDANFHHGYWDSDDDQSSNREACDKLTDKIIERTGDTSGTRLLDVGCGIGLSVFRLAGTSPSVDVVGLSNNQAQVDEANRRSAELGLAGRVRFECADALDMPYEDGSFDIVWLFETLPHLDRLVALTEAARVLRPGGRVVIGDIYLNARPSDADLVLVREHEQTNAFSPLLLEHEYREVVAESGLELVELKDISAETYRTGLRVHQAVDERFEEIVDRYGPDIIPLLDVVRAPAGLLKEIGYLLAVARKAD